MPTGREEILTLKYFHKAVEFRCILLLDFVSLSCSIIKMTIMLFYQSILLHRKKRRLYNKKFKAIVKLVMGELKFKPTIKPVSHDKIRQPLPSAKAPRKYNKI